MFNNQFKRTIASIHCVAQYLGNLPRKNTELDAKTLEIMLVQLNENDISKDCFVNNPITPFGLRKILEKITEEIIPCIENFRVDDEKFNNTETQLSEGDVKVIEDYFGRNTANPTD